MKKLLLFVIALFCLSNVESAATKSSSEKEIVVVKTNTKNLDKETRSISAQAKAWVDDASSILTVQVLYAQGGVDVILTNSVGETVYQNSAVADGSKQHLMLPALDSGAYYLTISCNGTQWDGELFLY